MFFQKRNLQEFFSKLSGSTVFFFFEENYKKPIFFNSEQLRSSRVNFCTFSLTHFPFS